MDTFLPYLLKSGICLLLLYSIYWLFLARETFFRLNRVYLTSSILLSLLIPLSWLSLSGSAIPAAGSTVLDVITVTTNSLKESFTSTPRMFELAGLIYIVVSGVLLLRFVARLIQLLLLVRRYGVTRTEQGQFVICPEGSTPFSFLNLIFMDENLFRQRRGIIAHESVHVRQFHTLDVLLLEILIVFQWFNPAVWLYRHSLRALHEYLADEGALNHYADRPGYQEELLEIAMNNQINGLTNQFNQSLIKRRFIMMSKIPSAMRKQLKVLVALPVIAGLIVAFSFTRSTGQNPQTLTASDTPATVQNAKTVDQMPEFKGGQTALTNYMISNIKYPESCKKNGIQGKVLVTFDVEKSGKVSGAKVIQSIHPDLDAEALRVISGMPDWTPGKKDGKAVTVSMTLPVMFKLGDKK